jgi:hypothetical protein
MVNSVGEVVNYDFVFNGMSSNRNFMVLYHNNKPVVFSSVLLIPEINVIHIGVVFVDTVYKKNKLQLLSLYNFIITYVLEHNIISVLFGTKIITDLGQSSSGTLIFANGVGKSTLYPNPFVHNINSIPPKEYIFVLDYILKYNRNDFLISNDAFKENFIIRRSNKDSHNEIFTKFIEDRKSKNIIVNEFYDKLNLKKEDEIFHIGKNSIISYIFGFDKNK